MERGNLEQKIDYCYRILDVFDIGILDIFTLREVLIRSFSQHIMALEKSIELIQKGNRWTR